MNGKHHHDQRKGRRGKKHQHLDSSFCHTHTYTLGTFSSTPLGGGGSSREESHEDRPNGHLSAICEEATSVSARPATPITTEAPPCELASLNQDDGEGSTNSMSNDNSKSKGSSYLSLHNHHHQQTEVEMCSLNNSRKNTNCDQDADDDCADVTASNDVSKGDAAVSDLVTKPGIGCVWNARSDVYKDVQRCDDACEKLLRTPNDDVIIKDSDCVLSGYDACDEVLTDDARTGWGEHLQKWK
jgi:hypothetical protein